MRLSTLLLIFLCVSAFAQKNDRKITFPDVPGYITLVADLHQHTVFSDGSVWPDIRVQEAMLDGVDVISLTEHIEYQPHKADLPHPDRNRSFEIAQGLVKNKDIILIHGAEITRSLPPGHANALFIQDANKLILEEPLEAYREAKAQGAFIFWNHPHWVGQESDGIAKLTDLHRQLIAEGLLHGIEVVNEGTYSDEALEIAQSNGLTIMGTSDIHGLIDWLFDIPGGGHRPVTLLFAEERSEAAVKAALEAGRSVAWFNNNLIGNSDVLTPLLQSSINVDTASYSSGRQVLEVTIANSSDARFVLRNTSDFTFYQNTDIVELPAQDKATLYVKTKEQLASLALTFEVLNALDAPGSHPSIRVEIQVEL